MTQKTKNQAVLPYMEGTAIQLQSPLQTKHTQWLQDLKKGWRVVRKVSFWNFAGDYETAEFFGRVHKVEESFFDCVIWVDEKPIRMKFRRDTGQHIYGKGFGWIDRP